MHAHTHGHTHAHNVAFVDHAYQEKPRPDLYSIVKKLRDMKIAHNRLLYIAEVKERANKANLEKDLSAYFHEYEEKYGISGLLLIMGNYYIHLIECEPHHFKNVANDLQSELESNNIYKGIWIIHYTEEKGVRLFDQWLCKLIAMSGTSKEIKNLTEHERYWTIYEGYCKISEKVNKDKEKGNKEFGMTIKQNASDLIPSGDELSSITTEQEMTLKEFIDFYFTPPDIVLEGERCWPAEPDLTY